MVGEEGERGVGSAKPEQVVSRQVVEGSVSSAVPARVPSWYEREDLPYEELVGTLRQLIQQARARHQRGHPDAPFRATEPFEPAEWLGWYLRQEVGRHTDGSQTQRQIFDLATAWDALYYTRYPSDGGHWHDWVRDQLIYLADTLHQPAISLPQRSVTLLDAMAEAAKLPRKRGEATIDLTRFATPHSTSSSPVRKNTSITRRPLRK